MPASIGNRACALDIHALDEAIPGQGAIHRTGVHIHKTQCLGDKLGVGALAAGTGAIQGYDDRVFQNSAVTGCPVVSG